MDSGRLDFVDYAAGSALRPMSRHDPPTSGPGGPVAEADWARLIDIALEIADREAPLMDALDAAVAALGQDAVRDYLLGLLPAQAPSGKRRT
jgi:hypothetical protein